MHECTNEMYLHALLIVSELTLKNQTSNVWCSIVSEPLYLAPLTHSNGGTNSPLRGSLLHSSFPPLYIADEVTVVAQWFHANLLLWSYMIVLVSYEKLKIVEVTASGFLQSVVADHPFIRAV